MIIYLSYKEKKINLSAKTANKILMLFFPFIILNLEDVLKGLIPSKRNLKHIKRIKCLKIKWHKNKEDVMNIFF